MSDGISLEVQGLQQLGERFESVPRNIARAIMRRSIKPAAQVILEEMIRRVQRRSGWLAQHLAINLSSRSRGDGSIAGSARIGPLRINYPIRHGQRRLKEGGLSKGSTISVASVAYYLEFGTRKMPAYPFMRQSFESRRDQALTVFTANAKAGFEEGAR